MKNKLLLLLLLLPAWGARAQTTLAQESFETNGEGTRYTSNSFDLRTNAASVAGAFPYFTRALTNPFVNPFNTAYYSFGTNAYPVTIGNVTGSVFWAAEAVESTATTPAAGDRPPGVVTLNSINASNYSSLTMTVALADARGPSSPTITQGGLNPQNETNDFIRLQYSTDGGATYNTIGQFVGNNSTGTGQGYMQLDVNQDGVITSADGAQSATNTLDINLRDFSFSIPGSPAALLVRVQIDQRGASEELAFDNIRVTGVVSTVAPPALANIETSPLSYLEGQAATQITSTLTVTNAAGNLSGGTVRISSGFVAGQDMLFFVNQNGISGSFNTGTGVLTLSGSASAATYQAALRSIAYRNTNTANATAGTRTIQFVVASGSTTSSVASRNVVVTSALNAATTLPYQEDFTTDGEGTRYASNTFTNSGTGAAWLRTSANPYQTAATTQTPTTFSGISNSFYWYGNNTNSTANPSRMGTLQTLPINTAGYVNLNFSLLLGASSGANASWQTADYFRVNYRQAGSSTWVPLIQFRGNSTGSGQGNLQRDADPATALGSAAPTGTSLTPALASFSAALPSAAYGQTLEFQLVLMADDIRAELAYDNLQLNGTQIVAPTVTTAVVTAITSTSAVLGGNVTNDGGANVTDRGVLYSSTNNTPTVNGTGVTKDANASGIGSYSKTIAGLAPGTTYYVRAYAINSVGTSYGSVVSFTTAAAAATVTTATPASITGTSAVLGGEITATGGATITDRGVVYVLGTGTPTTSDTKVTIGTGTGAFSQAITGLRGNTTYTVRAYATNSVGTAYGAAQTFTTPNNPPTANPDAATVAEDSGPTVISVLANDTSAPDVETLTITAVTQPANGTVTLSGGVVSFTPALNFNGQTSFTYTISDGNGGTATATVTVNVTPVNDAPVVTTTTGATTFTVGAGAVVIDNGLTVTDVDNATLASATVSITAGLQSGQDVLSFFNTSATTFGNVGTAQSANGTFTLTSAGATATVAQWQAVLRAVTFNNAVAGTSTATRTVAFVVNDGSLTSIPATKNITFAATTTVASIVRAGTSPTNAPTVAYTVTFANAVTGVSASNFAVGSTNLTGASIASVTGSGTTYTVTVNTGTLSPGTTGSVQLLFTTSTGISPVVTNPGLTGPAYVIDRDGPVTVISSSVGGSTNTSPIPFTVVFSESVTGFAANDVAVTNGTVTGGTISGSGSIYTFTVTPTVSGLVTVAVPANGAQDVAGNGNVAAAPLSITYAQPVTAAPVITSPANGSRLNTLTPTYSGTAPAGSTVTVYVDNANVGTTTATGGSFSLTPPTSLTEGSHTVYATAQTNGSAPSANSNTNTFTVDVTAPTVLSITRQSPVANPTNASTLTYRVAFSESVVGVSTSSFSLTSTGTASGTIAAVTPVGSALYDVTVTSVGGNGTLRLNLNSTGTGITDFATNSPVGGYTSGQTYTLDNTAPTATISTTATNPTSTSPIPFTVTFSEPVTGFAASSVSVTNGTITSAITNAGNAYSFSVTPTAGGTVTVSVPAGAAQDAAGNGNAATSPLSVVYNLPTPAPTVTTFSPATGPVGTQVTITGTNLSGATAVRFNGTAASSFVVNSATSITAVVAAGTTTGLVSVATPGGTATSTTNFVVRVAPTTVADAYTVQQGATLAGNVLTNDIGTNLVAILIIRPTHGTLALNPDGSFTYQPTAGYSGPDSFIYYACDPNPPLLCGNPVTVSITVLGSPAPTITTFNPNTGPVGTQVTITGTNLTGATAVRFNGMAASSFVVNSATSITAVVAAGTTTGLVSVTTPGGTATSATNFVVRVAPTTVADAYTTPQNVLLTGNVLSNDIGTNPQAILIIRPTHGTLALNPDGSFTYQPAAGYVGADSFIYYACNMGTPLVCGEPATVSITVTPATNTRTVANQSGENPAAPAAVAPSTKGGTAAARGVEASALALTGAPNPFRDEVQLTFALATTQAYTLAVYDAQGRLVQQLASGQAEAGQVQQVQVFTHLYAEGLYLVRLTTATGGQLLRLVKQ
jgi:hypothetical protein